MYEGTLGAVRAALREGVQAECGWFSAREGVGAGQEALEVEVVLELPIEGGREKEKKGRGRRRQVYFCLVLSRLARRLFLEPPS